MKRYKYLLTKLLGSEDLHSFEDRLLVLSTLLGTLACFVSIYFNIAMKLGIGTVLTVTISFFVFGYCYIIGRSYKKPKFIKSFFTIYMFVFCNFYWLENFGSKGSAMFIYLSFCSAMYFIWSDFYIILITFAVLFDILILFIIELNYPHFIPNYPNEIDRTSDIYVTFLIFLGVFSFLVMSAKRNYKKQYELAQKADKLKSAFLANMSHEIRTPLNAIVGFANLMARRELPKDKKEQFSILISDNSNYLLKLVSDILDISQIEAGQLKIENKAFSVNQFANNVFFTHERIFKEIGNKRVKFSKKIPSAELIIESDEVRIGQVLSNFIGNAIKFTTEGYIKFGFNININELVFYVEDSGSGISDELKPEVFNRFIKNDDFSDKKFAQGAGIGLSLSKELVELLGGKIGFTSKLGKGSTFYFSLPLENKMVKKDLIGSDFVDLETRKN